MHQPWHCEELQRSTVAICENAIRDESIQLKLAVSNVPGEMHADSRKPAPEVERDR